MPQPVRTVSVAERSMACTKFSSDTSKTILKWVKSNIFLICVMLGAIFGVVVGCVLRSFDPDETTILLVGFPGELFLRTFKLLLLPLVIASITTASSTLNAKTNGKMAAVTFSYFILSSFASSIIGLIMVLAIHPGNAETKVELPIHSQNGGSRLLDTILDLIRNMIPENIIQACLQQVQTIYTPQELAKAVSYGINTNGTSSGLTINETFVEMKRELVYRDQANFLGLILFFFVFGSFLGMLGEKGKPLANIFNILDSVILLIVTKYSWFTPIGVASLICERVASLPELNNLAAQLGIYVVTVIATLCIHIFIFIPIVYFVIVRKNPFKMISDVFQALFAAFATDSSAIALPMTLQCMEEKLHVDRRVTRFVLPLGVTINMNGTAAFLTLAAIFLAQMNGIEPTPGEQMSVVFSATLASVAAVAAPSASLFLLGIVMSVINGIPTEDIAMLFAIDWLLSRCRAICNVLGDCCGAAVVERICIQGLKRTQDEMPNAYSLVKLNEDERDREVLETLTIHP